MIRDKNISKLFVIMTVFIISSMLLGCATTPKRDSLKLTCPVCKKEMVHILEKTEEGNINCKTCKSELTLGGEHRCQNCGARIEDFSVTLPF